MLANSLFYAGAGNSLTYTHLGIELDFQLTTTHDL